MTEERKVSSAAKAKMKYVASHIKQVKFNFNLNYDSDIIDRLDQVSNKQGYVKELIRSDIAQAQRFATMATVEAEGFQGFYVDIVLDRTDKVYNLWLYHEKAGIKSLMIGLPEEAQTLADLVAAVPAFTAYNAPIYQEKYMQ